MTSDTPLHSSPDPPGGSPAASHRRLSADHRMRSGNGETPPGGKTQVARSDFRLTPAARWAEPRPPPPSRCYCSRGPENSGPCGARHIPSCHTDCDSLLLSTAPLCWWWCLQAQLVKYL
ncbi:Hypothetical protein SMAX5B_013392 [Scophthalmus maximus]|uniref:Uncharacterized protein n=1 Tax=Scophthalmus maximus TaxID=52904 RepID=A0A2U9B4Q9_SCOMX|nr:Hypothetical protein SMAX5B_013392 [Scophthalmus maximus]